MALGKGAGRSSAGRFAAVLFLAAGVAAAAQQAAPRDQAAGGRGQGATAQGGRQGGGRQGQAAPQPAGRIGAPVPPLGDGPWVVDTAEQHKLRVSVVTKGLVNPWSLAFLPDGSMLVTERDGRLRIIRNGVLDPHARVQARRKPSGRGSAD